MTLRDGFYDLLLTESLARQLAAVDPARAQLLTLEGGATDLPADLISRQLSAHLDDMSGDDAARRQLEFVNGLLQLLRQRLGPRQDAAGPAPSADVVDLVALPLRLLRGVLRDR